MILRYDTVDLVEPDDRVHCEVVGHEVKDLLELVLIALDIQFVLLFLGWGSFFKDVLLLFLLDV